MSKYNLRHPLGLSNHIAKLDNLMEQIVRCRFTLPDENRLNMYGEFLNLWFRFEREQLTEDSPTLYEFLQQQQRVQDETTTNFSLPQRISRYQVKR